MSAHYDVDVQRGQKERTTSLYLWRDNEKVAHVYPATQITESWTLVRDKYIKPTRYFDAHERAIEYQPGETIHGKKEDDFSYRYQLVSNKLIASMTLVKSEGTGCEKTELYSLETPNQTLELTWLPHLELIKHFVVKEPNMVREWTLQDVNYSADTNAFFTKRESYQSTDYADIGDDHTDPFLTKMVNQGFIEAGASGYYDQHGQAIGSSHTH
ncbi:hypothetical protein EYR97_06705 [Alteromonas sp. KUL42]|nr:hypothetical protein EYR97_06705 [Alteromonas sp. KUL42]